MKLKHFSLMFSFIGLLVLYLISILSQPSIINLNEIAEFEGKRITTEGVVTNYYSTKFGSQIITIEENKSSAVVFMEGKIEVEFGDKIKVTGEVQK